MRAKHGRSDRAMKVSLHARRLDQPRCRTARALYRQTTDLRVARRAVQLQPHIQTTHATMHRRARWPRFVRTGMAGSALALFVALLPAAAWAHAVLVRSEPKDKQALTAPPQAVRLWFNELLDRGLHAVDVFPANELKAKSRRSLTAGPPVVNPDDRTELRVELAPLAPGKYVVEYRVLSRDGHTAPGRITFEVLPPQ